MSKRYKTSNSKKTPLKSQNMKYLSLFSGIGGFEKGIQEAIGDKAECIGFSEVNKYTIKIYQKHFPNHKNYGDITKINIPKLPDFDLLVGGFPCQSFSVAGKRGGFEDTRGTLFFNIADILKIKRPKNLLLENVRGLLSHNGGNTFATIISTLDELGYDCQWQVLNSKHFGVPQNRERVFIVGHLRGEPRPKVFPFQYKQGSPYKKDKGGLYSGTITTANAGGTYECGAILIISQGKLRRRTLLEEERLQGFPDNWTEGVNNIQRGIALGNAVSVPVIRAIIEKLYYKINIITPRRV